MKGSRRRSLAGLFAALAFVSPSLADHATCYTSVSAVAPNTGDAVVARLGPAHAEELFAQGYTFPLEALDDARDRLECASQTRALVIFSAPRENVLALLLQTERQGEFLENLRSVRGLAKSENDKVDEHELRVLFTSLTYRVHNHWDEASWHIWWQLDETYDNDLRELQGYWQLYEMADGRTLAIYGTHVDVGPVFPKKVQDMMTRRTIRQAVHQFREWVDAEGQGGP
jgi:hypothetical protein